MKQAATLFVLFTFLCRFGHAQINADSLLTVWLDTSNNDTTRLSAMDAFVKTIVRVHPDSGIYYSQQALALAESIGDLKHQANALHLLGFAMDEKSDFDSALTYYNRSLLIREQIDDKAGMAKSQNNIGIVQNRLGNYDKSVECYQKSIKLKEEIGDEKGIATTLISLGTIHSNRGNILKAIELWRQSISINEKIGNVDAIGYPLNNIAEVYFDQKNYSLALDYYNRALALFRESDHLQQLASCLNNMGNVYYEMGDHDAAIKNYNEAIAIHKNIGNKRGIARSINTIGLVHFNEEDYITALECFEHGLALNEEIGNKKRMTSTLIYIGSVYIQLANSAQNQSNLVLARNQYSTSIRYNARALSIAEDIGVPVNIRDAANSLYQAYKSNGELDKALEMHELYLKMKDSIENDNIQRKIIEQEFRNEFEKQAISDSIAFAKQQELTTLEMSEQKAQIRSSRNLIFGLTSLIVLGSLVIVLGYQNYKRKVDQERALDIQVKSRTEELRSALDKLKDHQFNLAHKIRVPIASLLGMLEVIREDPASPEAEKIKLDVIDDSAKKIDDIIHEITQELHDK